MKKVFVSLLAAGIVACTISCKKEPVPLTQKVIDQVF